MSEEIKIKYIVDVAAALAAGKIIRGGSVQHLILTDEMISACSPEDRRFLADKLYPSSGTIDLSMTEFPRPSDQITSETLPAFVTACRVEVDALAARIAQGRIEQEERDKALAAEKAERRQQLESERDLLRVAFASFRPEDAVSLTGKPVLEIESDVAIKVWLANESRGDVHRKLLASLQHLALDEIWSRHRYNNDSAKVLDPPRQAMAEHLKQQKAVLYEQRKTWIANLVATYGTDADRERLEASVLPRADIDALVWSVIGAPDGNEDDDYCPICGDDGVSDIESGKPVSAQEWEAAKEIASAFKSDVLETIGLVLSREIVRVQYHCPSCESICRTELRMNLENPQNGWSVYDYRHYPLEVSR